MQNSPKGTDPAAEASLRNPYTWRWIGLLALLALVVALFTLQWLTGNRQTDVIPGTPITAPETAPVTTQ